MITAGLTVDASVWVAGAAPSGSALVNGLVIAGALLLAGSLIVLGVVLNAVTAGFRELAALNRRPR